MTRLVACLQLLGALACAGLAAITVGNMVMVARMSDTISVVHLLVGQVVLIACLLALARYLARRGLAGLRGKKEQESPD